MRRLKKSYYITLFFGITALLGIIRWTTGLCSTGAYFAEDSLSHTFSAPENTLIATKPEANLKKKVLTNKNQDKINKRKHNRIYSVQSFSRCFPDLQDIHMSSAKRIGVTPVRNRKAAEERFDELVYIGSCPFYKIDPSMSSSIPYLVPRAAEVLEIIARNYLDSLENKGVPMHKILVSSVLRTEEDVERLRKTNINASPESCHRYGTTFDIPYNRYHTVSPPYETRRTVQNDTLKWVLAEVLRDARSEGLCYIKYEIKQGCFHITAR